MICNNACTVYILTIMKTTPTGNTGSAKAQKCTAKSLPCVFCQGALQRAHGRNLHGKLPLPCASSDSAR
jgi:hypothetical protein